MKTDTATVELDKGELIDLIDVTYRRSLANYVTVESAIPYLKILNQRVSVLIKLLEKETV